MEYQKENNRINNIIETALKNIGALVDVNTVIGKPIKTDDNDKIVPISKVTLGVLSGGGEYGKVTIFKSNSDLPFSAGNGAIISVKPCGFLIKDANNDYKFISVDNNPYQKILDKATDILASIEDSNE